MTATLAPQTQQQNGTPWSSEVEKVISPYAYWPEDSEKPWSLAAACLVVAATSDEESSTAGAPAGSTGTINHNALWTCLMACCMDPIGAVHRRAVKEWGFVKGKTSPPMVEGVSLEIFTELVQRRGSKRTVIAPLADPCELSRAQTIIIANFALILAFFGLVPSTDQEYASLCSKIVKRYEALMRGKEPNPLALNHFMSFRCAKEVHKRAESWAGFRPMISMCLAKRSVLTYDTPQIEAWQVVIAQVCENRGLMPAKLMYEALCAAARLQIRRDDINQQGHTFLTALRQIRDGVRVQVGDQIETKDFTPYLHFFAQDAPALNPKNYKALVVLSTEYVNAMSVEMPQRYEAYKHTKLHTLASSPNYYYKPLSPNIKKQLAAFARMAAAMIEIDFLTKNNSGDPGVNSPTQIECLLEDQFHVKFRRNREQVAMLLDSFLL